VQQQRNGRVLQRLVQIACNGATVRDECPDHGYRFRSLLAPLTPTPYSGRRHIPTM
jgi:hypothetical protein